MAILLSRSRFVRTPKAKSKPPRRWRFPTISAPPPLLQWTQHHPITLTHLHTTTQRSQVRKADAALRRFKRVRPVLCHRFALSRLSSSTIQRSRTSDSSGQVEERARGFVFLLLTCYPKQPVPIVFKKHHVPIMWAAVPIQLMHHRRTPHKLWKTRKKTINPSHCYG